MVASSDKPAAIGSGLGSSQSGANSDPAAPLWAELENMELAIPAYGKWIAESARYKALKWVRDELDRLNRRVADLEERLELMQVVVAKQTAAALPAQSSPPPAR